MSFAEAEAHNAKVARGKKAIEPSAEGCDDESELHRQIIDECNRRRWYHVRSRMDKRTTTQKGVVDFIIATSGGITFWIEAKRKGGKLSQDQHITRHVLLGLEHRYACVYNFEQFLNAIKI